jgi:hypothetical protein
LGGFLAAVGDTLSYMASQAQLNEELCNKISEKAENTDSTQPKSKKYTGGDA